jgi:hypothetical protein
MFCNNALYYSICFGYGHVSVGCELACHDIARSISFYEFAACADWYCKAGNAALLGRQCCPLQ